MKPVNRNLKDGESASGSVNFVTRDGETVLRPIGHWSDSVHELLDFLGGAWFDYSPRFLGIDREKKQERLSYIHGEVALRPWPDVLLSHTGLEQVADMLKLYHETVAAYTPSNPTWHLSDRKLPSQPIIRHGDLGPWNMVWSDDCLVGLIDWDFAEPGTALEDFAQAAWQCIPLKAERCCLKTGINPEQQWERLKFFCQCCGVSMEAVLDSVKVLQDLEIERMQKFGAEGIEPWASFLKRGDVDFIKEDQAWLNQAFFPDLPPAPEEEFSHEDISVVFSKMTDGDLAKGFVPGYHFRILDSNRNDVGHINYRVGNSPHVRYAAGHIGYEIAEKHRGNQYASKACLALAPWLSSLVESILITVDPENIASIKTIEKIGAKFLDEVDVPEGDPHYLRGSLLKRRYQWKL